MKILLLFLCVFSFSLAQNLTGAEDAFFNLERQYIKQQNTIDSLKNTLNIYLEDIEDVKTREPENRDTISSMMARALEQSNRIDDLEKNHIFLGKQLRQRRSHLYKIYTSKIDSLEKLNQNTKKNEDAFYTKLKELKNRRLYVSPLLKQFSFDPSLVEKLKLSDSHSNKEKEIYKEYLDNALNEVDSNIINLQEKSANIREVIRLNEHVEDFMDDIEGEQFSGAFVVREQALRTDGVTFGETTDWRNTPLPDFAAVAKIYKRISPFIYETMNVPDYSLQDSVYTEDYLELLQETEKTLRLYREKIKDKLQ